jgi:CRP-like cAMP-binding protein
MSPIPDPTNSLREIIRTIPLCCDILPGTVDSWARESHIRRLEKGEVVFYENDQAEAVYIVKSGSISISMTSSDGRELAINEMLPGDCFGELGLLAEGVHTADAVTREVTQLIVIPRETFLNAIDTDPRLTRNILKTMAQRLSKSSEREVALAFLDAQARLARVLLEMDKQAAAQGYITVSQDDLARHSSLIRQTAAKILGRWRRLGWLVTGRGKIVLLNRIALRRIARGE